jgi:hypothetical protein
LTASSNASSMRSRLIITRFSGATTPRASASRSSAADLPEKSAPVADLAALVARRPAFSAFCWRARAWPPFFAAARRLVCPEREVVERLELELLLLVDFARPVVDFARPLVDLERLLVDFARLPPDLLRELLDPELRELVLRFAPELRLFEPDERRPPDEPDDPPLELPDDAAMVVLLLCHAMGGGTIPLRTRR